MDTVLQFILRYATIYFNLGLATGLVCGALLLLRPVLVRILSPRQRLLLWGTVWLSAYMPNWYEIFSWLHILPVTLRDFITPRTDTNPMYDGVPAYLPAFQGEGVYNLALPGGSSATVTLEPWMFALFTAVFTAGLILTIVFLSRGTDRLKAQAVRGRLLDWDGPELRACLDLRPEKDNVRVRLCAGLPTSFVYQKGERFQEEKYDMVYLQEELSPERRNLVLRHEINHIRLHHPWLKTIVSCGLVLHWWNPLVWLAFRYTCRDLELDCDDTTLAQLDGEQRREYAKTLVELGSGKQLWDAPLAFGESDGAVRVKAAVAWKERPFYVQDAGKQKNFWSWSASWAVCAIVLLFFVGGPSGVLLPADLDLQIARQYGDSAGFVQADLALQHREGNIPQEVTILRSWRQIDNHIFFRMAYQLSDGRWGESNWFRSDSSWDFVGWNWLSGPPDPAEYQPYFSLE